MKNAFQKRINPDLQIRIAEASDRNLYRDLLYAIGHRGEHLEFETDWKTKGNFDHIENRTGGFDFAILFKGQLVGTIRFKMNERRWNERSSNIGYELHPNFRGRGILTTCLRSCIDLVYANTDLDRLEVDGDTRNCKSEAVVKRLGFLREGIKRHMLWEGETPVDYWLYSMIRDEWRRHP